MKWAVAGKGGVGKTMLCAALARSLAAAGRRVFLIDSDPDPNLVEALALDVDPERVLPLVDCRKLIEERIGAEGLLRLNPDVADVPGQYQIPVADRISLMVVGAIQQGGAGCACGANVLVKSLVQHVLLEEQQDVLIDLEAGVEHLGRATVGRIDALLAVAEPTPRSFATVERIRHLAGQIKLKRVWVVGNRVAGPEDQKRLRDGVAPLPLLGCVGFHQGVRDAEIAGRDAYLTCAAFAREVDALRQMLLDPTRWPEPGADPVDSNP